jgi:Protein of unknown function (DUF3347)
MIMNTKLVFSVVSGAVFFAVGASAGTKDPVTGAYFKVEQAVVNEDLNAAKVAASALAQKAQAADNEAILKDATDLAKSESLDQVRQIFKALSQDTLSFIQSGEGSEGTACSTSDAQFKLWFPKSLGTTCSMDYAQCMQPGRFLSIVR